MYWLFVISCAKVHLFLFLPFLQPAATEVCTTHVCQQAASHILSTIDPSINPCDDFYKFACGGLFSKPLHDKPASLITLVEDQVDNQIKTMLEEPVEPSESKAIQSLKKFFKSCMDEISIEGNGLVSLKEILKQLGGWPVVEESKWQEDHFNFEDLTMRLRQMGFEYSQLFYFSISAIETDTISISTPITSLVKRRNRRRYRHFVKGVAILLGANYQRTSTELQAMVEFETNLYNIAYGRTKTYKTTFKNIQARYPLLNWLKLANAIYPNKSFSENDRAYFPSTNYLRDLDKLLKETSNRTIANYIIWKAIESVIPYIPKAFRNLKINYDASVSKRFADEERNRFNVCKWASILILPPTLETLYFKKYFSLEKKKNVDKFVWLIKDELEHLLNVTELYDDISRKRAIAKFNSITHLIGGPDELFHAKRLIEVFHEDEHIDSNDCLIIASTLNRQRSNHELQFNNTLRDIYSSYITVNAYYNSFTRSLVIPAAILQELYFNEKRPQCMNFGTLGMLVGHELTHAFGKNANEDDNLWTKATTKRFLRRSECIIQQANSFEIEGSSLHMNGYKTLEENACDYTGAKIAYQAYQNWIRIHGEEKQLPNLSYTPTQLFWISAANFFCDTVALDKLQQLIQEDPHAHPAFRIFGAMSNSEHFGSDFNCPAGSTMNPYKKCQIF